MARVGQDWKTPIEAIADGAIARGVLVKRSTDDSLGQLRVIVCSSKDDIIFGVALEAAADAGSLRVVKDPGAIVMVKADGAFSIGDKLMCADANGELDTYSETAGDNSFYAGIALHAAGGAGEYVPMLFRPQETQVED